MIGILASRADEASVTIAREVVSVATGEAVDGPLEGRRRLAGAELVTVDALHLDLTAVDARFEADPRWIAIVSRHAGETGPLLTAHFPGNIGEAEFGGTPRSVPPACPRALAAYVHELDARAPDGYAVGIECTHHGPTDSAVPLMFVEVGSDEAQWRDPAAARAVAGALWAVRDAPATGDRQLVGLGGGHYAPRFARVIRETAWDVGHIAPDWALEDLGADAARAVLPRLFAASGAEHCLIDGDHPALAAIVDELGHRVVSERWVRATSRVPVRVLEALEADLAPLDAGLVLGDRPVDEPGAYALRELPADLLAECAAIDRDATVAAVDRVSVAYTVDDEGSTPTGRLALPRGTAVEGLLDALEPVLLEKYDAVERTDEHLVASRRSFDPAAAAAAGVPEGPLFGRLAAGEAVTVDGRRIDPADVTRERTVTFDLRPSV